MSFTSCGEPNLLEDIKLKEIGEFIKSYLNDKLIAYFSVPDFRNYLVENKIFRIEDLDKIKAVNTVQIGDIPLTASNEFPILKLYRISSNWKKDNGIRESYIAINYLMNLPILIRLPGFLNWVDYNLNGAIQNWLFDDRKINSFTREDWIQDAQTSYSLLQGQQKDEFLSLIRTTLKIKESWR